MKVFIAGPYGGEDQVYNVRCAMAVAERVILAGHEPFLPHLFHFMHIVYQHEQRKWMDIDLAFLAVCNAVIRMEGRSEGADQEVAFAESRDIPVFDLDTFLYKHGA